MQIVSIKLNGKYLLNLLIIIEEIIIIINIAKITTDNITGRLTKFVGKTTNNRLNAKKAPATADSLVSEFEILYRKGINDIR